MDNIDNLNTYIDINKEWVSGVDYPTWMVDRSLSTLKGGYLMPGETPKDAMIRIARRVNELIPSNVYNGNLEEAVFKVLWNQEVCPSSPVWSNFGLSRGLPISCFGSYIEDSISGIYSSLAENAKMSQLGGGTSSYWGDIRHRGSSITNQTGTTGGPFEFLSNYDGMISKVSQGGCYKEGTKVLTDKGFKDFREVIPGTDLIAQLDEKNIISFTDEYELTVRDWDGELVKIQGAKKKDLVNISVTPNHRMVIERMDSNKDWKGNTEIVSAEDLKLHRDNRMFFSGELSEDGKGLSYEDKLRIAFQADGKKDAKTRKMRFHFSKSRKIERLKSILDNLNLNYTTTETPSGTTRFSIDDAGIYKEGTLDWINLKNLNKTWVKEFITEISLWDGSIKKNRSSIVYTSTIESNIEKVQAIASLGNKRSRVKTYYNREGNRKDLYSLTISDKPQIQGDSCVITREDYVGKVYCAIVPKGRLLVSNGGRTLVCGNTRRGSHAAYIDFSHPDVEEILEIKQVGCELQNLFTGVSITKEDREAIYAGESKALRVWSKILAAKNKTGIPYLLFKDNANDGITTPPWYGLKKTQIKASNLCITGDQRVVSSKGYLTAKELFESNQKLTLFDGEKSVLSSEMKLREKNADVYKITLANGLEHKVTDYHNLPVLNEKGELVKTPYKDLKLGDKIPIQVNKGLFGEKKNVEKAYLLGLYQSDGTQTDSQVFFDIWENDFDLVDNIEDYVDKIYSSEGFNTYDISNQYSSNVGTRVRKTPKFNDCVVSQSKVKKKRLGSAPFKNKLNFSKGSIPNWIYESNEETQWSYIKGLLEADGSATLGSSKGNPFQITYADTNLKFLKELQLLFNNLGLQSSIHTLHEERYSLMPDGKGGNKEYLCKKVYRLCIGSKNSGLEIEKHTGFLTRKNIKLSKSSYRDNSKKTSKIVSLEYIGKEDVYCPTVYTEDHIFTCQGLLTFNCSEIMLPSNENESFVCCLLSMNAITFDSWRNNDSVIIANIMLEAILEDFIIKTTGIAEMQKARRFAQRHRAVGLGILGYHSYLQSKNQPFVGFYSTAVTRKIMEVMKNKSRESSKILSKILGNAPVVDEYNNKFGTNHKARHSTLLAIAPTVSNSTISGGVSAGIEPKSSNYYSQKSAKGNFTVVNKYLLKLLEDKYPLYNTSETLASIRDSGGSVQHLDWMSKDDKDVFKTFSEINQFELVRLAAIRQEYIDQGQSLNVHIAPDTPAHIVSALYLMGAELGIKSFYYQRSTNVLRNKNGSSIDSMDASACVACEG
jgi:ribonucleoside-diphosphate reductase alpha chain